jgi:hypothetical protein
VVGHGMGAGGYAGARIVGGETFVGGHRVEWHRFMKFVR